MLANERARVREARGQRGTSAFVAGPQRIAERHGHVAQPAFMADAADRAAFGVAEKLFLGPCKEFAELPARESLPRIEIGKRTLLCKLVPRTDQLAVVAAVDAVG